MARQGKKVREKGKLRLSSYFKKIEDGGIKAVKMGRNYVIEKDALPPVKLDVVSCLSPIKS